MPTPEPAPLVHKKSVAREYLESIVVAVILALFIRTFAVQAFKIPTASMEDTLLIGDHLLVNRLAYSPSFGPLEDTLLGKRPIARGDVVVFKYPVQPERDFIKRVIGLPGETVEMRDKQVLVNGQPLPEDAQVCSEGASGKRTCRDADPSQGGPYKVFLSRAPLRPDDTAYGAHGGDSIQDNWGPQTVPAGHLLVLGDNRDNSADGRVWGFLPIDQVKGRALIVYWSLEADREDYQGASWGGWRKVLDPRRWRWKRMFHVIH